MNNLGVIADINFEALFDESKRTIGGAASVVKSIVGHLQADKIICFGITSDKNVVGKEIFLRPNIIFVPFIYVPIEGKVPVRLLIFIKGRGINRFLNKYSIDSVYSHCIEMSFWVKSKYGVIEHMHGSENAVTYASFSNLRLSPLIGGWEYIRSISLKKAKKIIAIDELCFQIAQHYNDSSNILLIPNFVDTEIFFFDFTACETFNTNKRVILFVGRIEEVKGLELFIDIIESLNKENDTWVGVIIGKGGYQSKLEEYIAKKGCQNFIIFIGPIYKQSELRKFYSKADVLLMTSYREGIPMTVLESLACGTPVVSTDVGGIKSLNNSSAECLTIKDRNTEVFVETILKLEKVKKVNKNFPYSVKASAEKINEALRDVAKKNKIFAPIPLPPPFHGSNIMNATVVNSKILNDKFDFKVFGISYNKDTSNIGYFNLRKIILILKYFFIICVHSFKSYDLVYYSPAIKGFAFYRDFLLLLPLKFTRKKIVIHLHGKGIANSASKNGIDKILYKLFFMGTSVICLSERLTYDVNDVFTGSIYIVNNGIEEIDYPERVARYTAPVILFLSNFIETKGIFTFLETAKQLKSEGFDFKLNLVGEPQGKIYPCITNFIEANNLQESIISIGPKYGEEKQEAFAEADIFVFPTEHDCAPLVVNEAMQASLPVITTSEGALPDMVEDQVTGFIIQKGSPEQLANKLKLLLADENLRLKMGQAGYEKYLKKYTSTIMQQRMSDVLSGVLDKCNN